MPLGIDLGFTVIQHFLLADACSTRASFAFHDGGNGTMEKIIMAIADLAVEIYRVITGKKN